MAMVAHDVYKSFLWTRILYGRVAKRISVVGACVLWVLIQLGMYAVVTMLDGNLVSKTSVCAMGLMDDTVQLANFFVIPLCYLVLFFALREFADYLDGVSKVLRPDAPHEVYGGLLRIGEDVFARKDKVVKYVVVAVFGVGLFAVLFNAVSCLFPDFFYGRLDKWDGRAFPLTYVVNRVFVLIVWGYFLPVWCSITFMMFWAMTRINREIVTSGYLSISPCATDEAAGLGCLSSAALWLGYAILPLALFVLAPVIRGVPLHFGNYIVITVFGPLAGLIALYPLIVLHKALKARKKALLAPVMVSMDDVVGKLARSLEKETSNSDDRRDLITELEGLVRLQTVLSQMPTWPLNTKLVSRLAAMVLAPAIALAIKILPRIL